MKFTWFIHGQFPNSFPISLDSLPSMIRKGRIKDASSIEDEDGNTLLELRENIEVKEIDRRFLVKLQKLSQKPV
jgi:hypothetical protein